MKVIKILVVMLTIYIGIVVAFESLIGYFQPADASTLVITTTDDEGAAHPRVVSALHSGDQLYVAANHWPRAWYRQALARPDVEVTVDGETAAYVAVPVVGAEHDRINQEHALGPIFRTLTGFPPRYFVRLEPR